MNSDDARLLALVCDDDAPDSWPHTIADLAAQMGESIPRTGQRLARLRRLGLVWRNVAGACWEPTPAGSSWCERIEPAPW